MQAMQSQTPEGPMSEPTITADQAIREKLYDKRGVRIMPGDLLKVFHFVAALRREKHYMYHVVIEEEHNGKLVLVGKSHNVTDDKRHYYLSTVAKPIYRDAQIIATAKFENNPRGKIAV